MKSLAYGFEDFWCRLSTTKDSILGDLQPKIALVYIDNIKNFSPMLEHYHEDVDCFLERLSVASLNVNVIKCVFACEEVVVLGTFVSKDGINLNSGKLQGIYDPKPPKNVSGKTNSGNVQLLPKVYPEFCYTS